MKTDRDSMLDRIRDSLRSAHLPSANDSIPPRTWPAPQLDSAALADSFAREASTLGVNVHRPSSRDEAIETVLTLLREIGANNILAWGDDDLCLPEVGKAIRAAEIRIVDPNVSPDSTIRREQLSQLGGPLAGVTGALAGLADTGTLALLTGPTQSRLASLLPPTHIALLSISHLYPDMASFFVAHPDAARNGSNLVFVTGPSRTGDIELTLTVGVHGPKTIHIILIDAQNNR
ncbi:MAG: hypothetical protein FJ030_18780 [Chloroflexi bacterium]|nr:hypothetical protein [Chloroflexota bacterium]